MGRQAGSDIGAFIHFRGGYRLVLCLREHYGKHGETSLPFDPVIPVFAISTKENSSTEAKGHTQHCSSES